MRPGSCLFSLVLAAVLLAGCEPGAREAQRPDPCAGATNLLRNPGFQQDGRDSLAHWQTDQHAGDRSFELTVDDGTVVIERIGPEPWYTLLQAPQIDSIRGRDMVFRAELRLDLDGEGWQPALDPGGGLHVIVWGAPLPRIGGSRQVFRYAFEDEPRLGRTDWVQASVAFQVPEDASRANVGFMLRASGSLSLRNPELLECSPGADADAPPAPGET